MKLKEWMDFNKPFMACDFQVALLKNRSWKTEDILIETVVKWDACRKFFGDYTIARLNIGKYPTSTGSCFRLLLWDDQEDNNAMR